MAEYISFQPKDYFNTKLYTGTGATHSVTGVGFQPDFTWIKQRNGTYYHQAYDSVRGAGYHLAPNDPAAQSALDTAGLSAWGVDGFTVNTRAQSNYNTATFVAWDWKMGTTSGLSGGTITPTGYSINTTAGQSIIAYTGTGSNATLPHGLGVAPEMIIVKRLNSSDNWTIGHQSMKTSSPWDWANKLNTTAAPSNDNTQWNDTAPTSTLFSIGTSTEVNNSTSTYIAYCFAPVKGYSKFRNYYGNSDADGQFIYTGFRPAYVLIKATVGTINWNIYDTKRTPYNPEDPLWANTTGTESSIGAYNVDLLSNGFKARTTSSQVNSTSYDPYVYMAFAESPIVSSNDVPGVAR